MVGSEDSLWATVGIVLGVRELSLLQRHCLLFTRSPLVCTAPPTPHTHQSKCKHLNKNPGVKFPHFTPPFSRKEGIHSTENTLRPLE